MDFDETGKYQPHLDRDYQPVVDPTLLKRQGPFSIDYTKYTTIKSVNDLDTKRLTVSRKCNKDMYAIYVDIKNSERHQDPIIDEDLKNTKFSSTK